MAETVSVSQRNLLFQSAGKKSGFVNNNLTDQILKKGLQNWEVVKRNKNQGSPVLGLTFRKGKPFPSSVTVLCTVNVFQIERFKLIWILIKYSSSKAFEVNSVFSRDAMLMNQLWKYIYWPWYLICAYNERLFGLNKQSDYNQCQAWRWRCCEEKLINFFLVLFNTSLLSSIFPVFILGVEKD